MYLGSAIWQHRRERENVSPSSIAHYNNIYLCKLSSLSYIATLKEGDKLIMKVLAFN